jgi:hypothetical protein
MPMLRGCSFDGCETFTLSTYCFDHELLIRAETDGERAAQVATRDESTARELAEAAQSV